MKDILYEIIREADFDGKRGDENVRYPRGHHGDEDDKGGNGAEGKQVVVGSGNDEHLSKSMSMLKVDDNAVKSYSYHSSRSDERADHKDDKFDDHSQYSEESSVHSDESFSGDEY